jgi:hypothetical protein
MPRKEQLLVTPRMTRANILSGERAKCCRRRTKVGIRCRAPYTGSMDLCQV